MWCVFACSLLLCCFMLMLIALLRVLNPLRGSCGVCCWVWVLSWVFLASCMFECWSKHWLCYVSDLALSFVRFQSLFCSLLYLLACPAFSTLWSWRRCRCLNNKTLQMSNYPHLTMNILLLMIWKWSCWCSATRDCKCRHWSFIEHRTIQIMIWISSLASRHTLQKQHIEQPSEMTN